MLYLLKPVDIVKAIVINDLHCLFLGVTKLLIYPYDFQRNTGRLISTLVERLADLEKV